MEFVTLATELGFTEGPVFCQDGRFAVVSLDRGVVYELDASGSRVLARPEGAPNGAAEDVAGNLYIAQSGGSPPAARSPGVTGGVQVIRPEGRIEWVTRDPVSPNDLCFGPGGLLYVTDPSRPRERDDGRLWQIDVGSGESEQLTAERWYPNGIAFGLDPDKLFVASTNDRSVVCFDLADGSRETFATLGRGHPDGMAFDCDGNLYVAAVEFDGRPGSIQVFDAAGSLLHVIEPGRGSLYTNLAIDPRGRMLVTASDTGAVLLVDSGCRPGLPLYPFRERTQ